MVVVISVVVALYAVIGIALAGVIWKHIADDEMRETPYATEAELKRNFFIYCLFLWPVLITKIKVEREEGFGVEFTVEEDDEDEGHPKK